MELRLVYYSFLFQFAALVCPKVPMASDSDVSVFCEHTNTMIYWFRLRHPAELPVPLLHTIGPGDDSVVRNPGTSDRFSVTPDGTLVIGNATEEDKNSYYYCVEKDKKCEIIFRNVTIPSRKNIANEAKPNNRALHERCSCTVPVWAFIALSLLLVVFIHFFVYITCVLKSKNSQTLKKLKTMRQLQEEPGMMDLEGDYQTLSHKDTAVYDVCIKDENIKRNKENN